MKQCVQCGKQWKYSRLLVRHKKQKGLLHNDECTQCSKKISSYQEYQKHVQDQHYGLWKFKCGHCAEIFDSEEIYLKHSHKTRKIKANKKYTTNKPIKTNMEHLDKKICDECGAKVYKLWYHMKYVHGKDEVPCPHCGIVFNR